LLVACLWLKSMELYTECAYLRILAKDGQVPSWRFQAWKLSSQLHAICEVLLLLMTALGWRLLRPRLSQTEIRFTTLTVSITSSLAVLQACAGASPVLSFSLLFFVVQVACYLVIILAMNWNLTLIAVHLTDSPVTLSVAILYQKQQAFLLFRRVFLAIIVRPSAVAWLGFSILDDLGAQWALMLLDKASLWLIYVGLFMVLRPVGHRGMLMELVLNTTSGEARADADGVEVEAAADVADARLVAPRNGTVADEVLGDAGWGAAEMAREVESLDLAIPYVPLAGDG